jgi:hypothetical protein
MEVWQFCAAIGIPTAIWTAAFIELFQKDPPESCYQDPQVIELDYNGNLSVTWFDTINAGLKPDDLKLGKCRICWGIELATIIRDHLTINHVPTPLAFVECWCRK